MARALPKKLPANPVKALFEACRDGDEAAARALVELGASFATGGAALVVAARGSLELLDVALAHGLPRDGAGAEKVLDAAIRHGRPAHLGRLLEQGVDLGALPLPLHAACGDPPGVSVDPAARRQVLDLLLEHGAAIDEHAPTGSTPLGWAIQRGDAAAAEHLLGRGADVSSGLELHAAFASGWVALARTMAARGAPLDARGPLGFALSEVVEADLVTPRELSVRYSATDEPQRVRVELRLARFTQAEPPRFEQALGAEARVFARLGALGALGGVVREESFSLERGERGFFEVATELTLSGVSAQALAFALRSLCRGQLAYPARLALAGEAPLGDAERSVTTERARAWFAHPELDGLPQPEALPFEVTDAPEDGVLAVVSHQSGAGQRIADSAAELAMFVPPLRAVRQDRGVECANLGIIAGKSAAHTTKLLAVVTGPPGAQAGFDPELTRALALRAFASYGGVERVTWCLPRG